MEDRHRLDLRRLPAALPVLAAILAFGGAAAAEPLRGIDVRTGAPAEVSVEGPVTHVVFLAGWCPPCLAQIDELRKWETRYGADGYRLVIVAVGRRQTAERVGKLDRDRELPGRLLFDSDGSLESRWSIADLPHHRLLDANGNDVWIGDEPNAEATAAVERLLQLTSGEGR